MTDYTVPVVESDPNETDAQAQSASAIDAAVLDAASTGALGLAVASASGVSTDRIAVLEQVLTSLLSAASVYLGAVAQPGTHTTQFAEACAVAQQVLTTPSAPSA